MTPTKNLTFSSSSASFTTAKTGFYRIECYGAQGGGRQVNGNGASGIGGKGGYASGVIRIEKGVTMYVYVGTVGSSTYTGIALGGFNGGGAAFGTSSSEPASGGGGASDVRLISGDWDNPQGLLSRIIVAGGGGGGGEDCELGGYGGGESGGQGGTTGSGGVFGKGAHTSYDGGGGGGGWYGGNTNGGSQSLPTSGSGSDTSGGSGGSGYVYTSTSSVVSGYLVPAKYQMTNVNLTGNVNEGNGKVIITPLIDGYFGDSLGNLSCKQNRMRHFLVLASLSNIMR